MYYTFDLYGRFSGTSTTPIDRCTTVAPKELTPDYNWNGFEFVYAPNIVTSTVAVVQPETAKVRHISVGAFYDRFGSQKWGILSSSDPVVQAFIKDASVRKFIDLSRPDLLDALNLMVSSGFSINPESIVGAEIEPHELP